MAIKLSAVQWIEVLVALLLLIFNVVVFAYVVKYRSLPFNKYWKTRAIFVTSSFVWILSLLIGREQFWSPGGFFSSVNETQYTIVCETTTVLTFGVSQPLFFITLLLLIRSKTNASNDLVMYGKHPNGSVIIRALLWTLPMCAVHVLIVGLSRTLTHDSEFFWTTYDTAANKCVVPIISTMAFTLFYAIFLICYIYYSRKFSKTLINKRLIQRVWWSQVFFSLFFPFEVLLRFILIFTTKFQVAGTVLSHIFFFIDLIICFVGLLEFVLLPILDAAEFPLYPSEYDNLLADKGGYTKRQEELDHNAIVLDNINFEAKKQPSTAAILTSAPTTTSPTTNGPAYKSEQQSEEFRKQMARYSSNV